jgi:hypothetical protein
MPNKVESDHPSLEYWHLPCSLAEFEQFHHVHSWMPNEVESNNPCREYWHLLCSLAEFEPQTLVDFTCAAIFKITTSIHIPIAQYINAIVVL